MSAKRASWLMLVCEYWLSFHGGDYHAARMDEPTYDLPKSFDGAARFNKARKECGAWDRTGTRPASYKYKVLKDGTGKWTRAGRDLSVTDTIPIASPSVADKWNWAQVFDSWFYGALEESIEALKGNLPEENVKAIEKAVL